LFPNSLQIAGTEISTEPSYILLNTAVSKQWGFPLVCADNCKCKEFDCHSNDYNQRCGFSDGFCEMMTLEDPQYYVNYVRVYQDPTKEEQKVGCSTPERPTRRYIEAHEKLYKLETDDRPLKPIQVGRGACDPRADPERVAPESCGGPTRGHCTNGKVCECKNGWVGPHCLAVDSYDSIVWDQPDKLSDVGFIPPHFVSVGLIVGLSFITAVLLITMRWRKQLEAGWTRVPDVDKKFYSHIS
jgi:hypothetical protein